MAGKTNALATPSSAAASEVADDHLDRLGEGGRGRVARRYPDLMAVEQQLLDQAAADGARGSGDEVGHGCRAFACDDDSILP
jgi:hypothetical protein